ncbi:ABC transporter permease [Paenibacillus sp. 453mf]|uniref:ABC transporter permease n=1 Tax=Paenibacillus sp. 453mf TaxID=1761874 RepID=UPI0008F3EB1C|nr:ABC transporter permease [Paenibacillus sp. 453mf]SFS70108.1 peptide/nickel transport system permease protein [Paenibacillus sp. 453mf]
MQQLERSSSTPGVRRSLNTRGKNLIQILISAGFLAAILLLGSLLPEQAAHTSLSERNLVPGAGHFFGTDWLGRDMFNRTLKGLAYSIQVGLTAAVCSSLIALLVGLLAAAGRRMDQALSWFIDLFMSVPHLVSLILIAFAFGGGAKGVIVAIACTHWPQLARVIRADMLQLQSADYIQVSRRLGKSRGYVALHHMLPHLVPQLLVGLLLVFPHAILHEAAITFLGLGLSPQQPAIGIILSESMKYLSAGMWWLAFFPGLALTLTVLAFDTLGHGIRSYSDPIKLER